MKSEEFSKNILSLDPAIRFAGLIESSGYLFAGGMREGIDTQLKGKNSDLSLFQSAHIVFLREGAVCRHACKRVYTGIFSSKWC